MPKPIELVERMDDIYRTAGAHNHTQLAQLAMVTLNQHMTSRDFDGEFMYLMVKHVISKQMPTQADTMEFKQALLAAMSRKPPVHVGRIDELPAKFANGGWGNDDC